MARVPCPSIENLAAPGCLFLLALVMAQEQRLPVSPTFRVSLEALDLLNTLGVIETPAPATPWAETVEALETPIERFRWRRRWDEHTDLPKVLLRRINEARASGDDISMQLRVWRVLVLAEVEQYFEQQLIKHHFDRLWANDLSYIYRHAEVGLSIAQWRYCCWAATRQGASIALQTRQSDAEVVREAIYLELGKRARHVSKPSWDKCSFPPSNALPKSALARLFASEWTQLGADYWILPPEERSLGSKQ